MKINENPFKSYYSSFFLGSNFKAETIIVLVSFVYSKFKYLIAQSLYSH